MRVRQDHLNSLRYALAATALALLAVAPSAQAATSAYRSEPVPVHAGRPNSADDTPQAIAGTWTGARSTSRQAKVAAHRS